jgi:hypothetical protein
MAAHGATVRVRFAAVRRLNRADSSRSSDERNRRGPSRQRSFAEGIWSVPIDILSWSVLLTV